MRSNEAKDEALRQRLEWAVGEHAGGSADAFARLIGYTNGGYIREIVNKKNNKVVREALIERVNTSKECPALHGLFDDILKTQDEDRVSELAARMRRLPDGPRKDYLLTAVGALIRDAEAQDVPVDITHQHKGTPALKVKPPVPVQPSPPAGTKSGGKAHSST